MRASIRERSTRRPVCTDPWSLQPVARIIGARPSEFIRRKTWTAPPRKFNNGISAVTSLCLADEACAGGPPLLISGDEDGGVSVERVGTARPAEGGYSKDLGQQVLIPTLRRVRLHDSCVNTIKLLPDKRGFVCASDDGVLSAVASLEGGSEGDLGRATLALHGHSGFVTDCDTASSGHAILSSSTDGNLHLWDPVAGNTPVASVVVGRPVNSACFSSGDPYAVLCAPERFGTAAGGGAGRNSLSTGSDELVQIWDIRSLRCFRDSLKAAVAAAFGEPESGNVPLLDTESYAMAPPPPQSPTMPNLSVSGSSAGSCRSGARRESGAVRAFVKTPWWKSMARGSSTTSTTIGSPLTPLQRQCTWASDSSDNEFSSPWSSGSSWSRAGDILDSSGNEISYPFERSVSTTNTDERCRDWSMTPNSTVRRRDSNTFVSPESCVRVGSRRGPPRASIRGTMRDRPLHVLCQVSMPDDDAGCLHQGTDGKSWVPGGSLTWRQPGNRRTRRAQDGIGTYRSYAGGSSSRSFSSSSDSPPCRACDRAGAEKGASVYSVQVTSDGRGILTASRDATVTLWDAQLRKVLYRFGHERLSLRARPLLSGTASKGAGECPRWGRGKNRFDQGGSAGEVFAGMTDGAVRAWRLGSRFPHRVFKPTRRHEGFEVTCIAESRGGALFASADSSGKVWVQSATCGEFGPGGDVQN